MNNDEKVLIVYFLVVYFGLQGLCSQDFVQLELKKIGCQMIEAFNYETKWHPWFRHRSKLSNLLAEYYYQVQSIP